MNHFVKTMDNCHDHSAKTEFLQTYRSVVIYLSFDKLFFSLKTSNFRNVCISECHNLDSAPPLLPTCQVAHTLSMHSFRITGVFHKVG